MNRRDTFTESARLTLFTLFVGGGITLLLFLTPILIWLGWNVCNVGNAVGLSDLGFGGIVLATLFCIGGAFWRAILAGIIFLIGPDWLDQSANMHFPHGSYVTWLGILFLFMAFVPSARARSSE